MDQTEEQEQWYDLLNGASNALAALTCPWYQGTGSCSNGCQTEPSCQTDAPSGGWEAQLLSAATAIAERATGEG